MEPKTTCLLYWPLGPNRGVVRNPERGGGLLLGLNHARRCVLKVKENGSSFSIK